MEAARQDIKISGAGSCGGGVYGEVKISGAGAVNGDIDCNTLKSSGSSDIRGNIKAQEIKCSGSSSVKGSVETETMEISGSSDIKGNLTASDVKISGSSGVDGDVRAKRLKISGGSDVKGNLYGGEIRVSGGTKIGKDCECENFISTGKFDIKGLLNADEIDIELFGRCKVREIGGRSINIKFSSNYGGIISEFVKSMFVGIKELVTDSVEGDDIFLEGTTAKIVRGTNVTIGEGCNIEKVEYTGELKVVNGGKVKNEVKL